MKRAPILIVNTKLSLLVSLKSSIFNENIQKCLNYNQIEIIKQKSKNDF